MAAVRQTVVVWVVAVNQSLVEIDFSRIVHDSFYVIHRTLPLVLVAEYLSRRPNYSFLHRKNDDDMKIEITFNSNY